MSLGGGHAWQLSQKKPCPNPVQSDAGAPCSRALTHPPAGSTRMASTHLPSPSSPSGCRERYPADVEKSTQMIKEALDKRYGGPWCVGCTAMTSCTALREQAVGGELGSGSGRANPSPHIMHAACRHVVVGRAFAFEVSHEVRAAL